MGPRHEGRGERLAADSGPPAVYSFNGATARRPWRTRLTAASVAAVWSASMGPRHEGRGEPATRPSCFGPAASFNGATARRPWRTTVALPEAVTVALSASMGPRHEGRGEQFRSQHG